MDTAQKGKQLLRKNHWLIHIVAGIVLYLNAMSFGIAQGLLSVPIDKAVNDIEEILKPQLKSHTTWQSMNGEASTI